MTWERLENESAKAYEAFALYRDMGSERAVRKVAEKLSKSLALITRWAAKYQWTQRVREWDDHADEIRRKASDTAIKEMSERHLKFGEAFQGIGAAGLRQVKDAIDRGDPINPRLLDVAIRASDFGMKTERYVKGEPTERIEIPRIRIELVSSNDSKAD